MLELWDREIPLRNILRGRDAVSVRLIAKFIYLTAVTRIGKHMVIKGNVKNVLQHAKAGHAAPLNGLETLLNFRVGGGMTIGQTFVKKERAHQGKMSSFERVLNTGVSFDVVRRPFLRVIGAKKKRRNSLLPYLISRQLRGKRGIGCDSRLRRRTRSYDEKDK